MKFFGTREEFERTNARRDKGEVNAHIALREERLGLLQSGPYDDINEACVILHGLELIDPLPIPPMTPAEASGFMEDYRRFHNLSQPQSTAHKKQS